MSSIPKIISATAGHESGGNYGAINLDTSSNNGGIAYGLVQWTQSSGNLGRLLAAMRDADPVAFATTFGPRADVVVATLTGASPNSIALTDSVWTKRLRDAGNVPAFRRVQDAMASDDEHMQAALRIAQATGLKSEKSIAVFYDTAIQQGPNGARGIGDEFAAWLANRPGLAEGDALAEFIARAAGRYRRTSPGQSGNWKQGTDGRWYKYTASGTNLYRNVLIRREKLVDDPSLSWTAAVLP